MNASIENTTTGSSTVVDDISSPYFLHNGDSPIIMLVTHLSLVEKKNYPSWSRSMIMALTVQNKVGFMNGF